MDPTSLFFSRLRRLAVTLETETQSLQDGYQTRADRGDGDAARGMGAYHALCSEVAELKGEIRVGLGQQRSWEAEVSSFLVGCGVMQRRLSEDVHTLTGHFEKYGYQAPPHTHTPPEPADRRAEEEPASVEDEEEGGATERKDPLCPQSAPPPTAAQIRTPQLSDFGLSEVDLRHMLTGAHGCPEAPPMPVLSLPPLPSSLATPLPPALLLMQQGGGEEEELRTPQMKDFGLSQHMLCLNDDPTASQMRTPQLSDFGLSEVDLRLIGAHGCPEPLPKPALSLTPPPASLATPLSPTVPLTPKCALRMEEEELRTPQMKDFGITEHTLCLNDDFTMGLPQLATRSTNPHHQQPPPQPATLDLPPEMKNLTSEMPKMESMFSSTLLNRSAQGMCESGDPSVEPQVYNSPEVDGPTQEFNLRTPRVRLAYWDPPTPEMPNLSSITQDICKLVSRTELKTQSAATRTPRALEEEKRAALLPLVVEAEFQMLPHYLRQMTLISLNDSIHKINAAAATKQHHGEALHFQTEELKSITRAGTKAPIYFLCLEELHRLEVVQSVSDGSVYKLLPRP